MATTPHQEIDHRTLKLMVGLVALFLASATSFLSGDSIASISKAHCYGGWSRDLFVGSLFAIAAFMAAYNGNSRREMLLTKATAVAAIGVAWFPTACGAQGEILPGAHVAFSIIMFATLALLCRVFYLRARARGLPGADRRAVLYAVCGILIPVSMGVVVVDALLGRPIATPFPRLEFYCEQVALVAFGAAWLAGSHVLPWVTAPEERWFRRWRRP
jgi:hypothetical protein